MTAISSYYANVGIRVDRDSIKQVDTFLKSVQSKMNSFAKGDGKGVGGLTLRINNFSVNQRNLRAALTDAVSKSPIRIPHATIQKVSIGRTGMMRAIREALGASTSGKVAAIRLNNFSVNQKALVAAINSALNVTGRTSRIRLGAMLSQASLTDMRNQIRQSINQLVVNPTINPRINAARVRAQPFQQSTGGSGGGSSRLTTRDPRSMNPWHNPMMIGGSAGAFMRYGMFSLPFVAGAYGLNELSKNMETLQNAEMAIMAQVGDRDLARNELDFLYRLGRVHGVKMTDMAPGYSQMYAAAQGTVLGDKMQDSFQSFLQYASVIGMNEDQKKGAILALSQIVGKGGKNFAQELNLQLTKYNSLDILAEVKPI